MKKVLFFLVLLFLLISLSVYAQGPSYLEASTQKAKHGFVNILTGWLEIPFQAFKGFKNGFGEEGKNKLIGGVFGVFRGAIHALGRTTCGAYQLATFPLPNPRSNEGVGVPLDSQNVWEEGNQYSIANEGIAPIGRKALRGTINTMFGIVDIPAQIGKGFSEDKPFMGLVKAIVFPVARIVSGAYDLGTAFLPNDAKGYGYPLEEKNPWDAFDKTRYNNDK